MMGVMAEGEWARRRVDYMDALEEERRKIQVFQRELPLCLELVTQTIASHRQQMESEIVAEKSDCGEGTSRERGGPVVEMEEFMPVKHPSSCEEAEDESNHNQGADSCAQKEEEEREDASDGKMDWLKSVQLWNHSSDQAKEDAQFRKPIVVREEKRRTGAFRPFRKEKSCPPKAATPSEPETKLLPPSPSPPVPSPQPAMAESSTADTGGGGCTGGTGSSSGQASGGDRNEHKKGTQSLRKARRCWSPELHRRFLHALQQLGGAQAATPKQILELMKVDGLTSDEVKSHLQKYRIHTRRPATGVLATGSSCPQTPQFILVGSIWVPPPEYVAAVASATSTQPTESATCVYAPVASVPSQTQARYNPMQEQTQTQRSTTTTTTNTATGPFESQRGITNRRDGCGEDVAANSNSPAMSSTSFRTTTVSTQCP